MRSEEVVEKWPRKEVEETAREEKEGCLAGFELYHSLSPLLIKHPMPALLAPDRLRPLQANLAIAVAAEIADRGTLGRHAAARAAGGRVTPLDRDRGAGGRDVGVAVGGHCCWCFGERVRG